MVEAPSILLLAAFDTMAAAMVALSAVIILRSPHPLVPPSDAGDLVRWARAAAPWALLLWVTVLAAIGAEALLSVWGTVSPLSGIGACGGIVTTPIAILFVLIRTGRPRLDPRLTERCRQIAQPLGIDLARVRVIETSYGRKSIDMIVPGRARRLSMLVCVRLVELLSPEELDFMCACKLAEIRLRAGRSRDVAHLAAVSAMIPLAYLMFPSARAVLAHYWIPLVALFAVVLKLATLMDRGLPNRGDIESEADRIALQTVGRLDVAESCLGKMREFYDTNGERALGKGLPNRIAALREAAQELGMDLSAEWVQR